MASTARGGFIACESHRGRSEVTRCFATYPLKLIVSSAGTLAGGVSALVYAVTYGGGILAGDRVELSGTVGEGAALALLTQASTKIYRAPTPNVAPATQILAFDVADGGLLVLLPHPVACFASARYSQRQTFDLMPGGSLVVLDWFTAGRTARGERWAFAVYASRTEIFVDGAPLVVDGVRLASPEVEGGVHVAARMGSYDAVATAFLVGPRVERVWRGALTVVAGREVSAVRGGQTPDTVVAASPLGHTPGAPVGAAVRVAGPTTERVRAALCDILDLRVVLGFDPWAAHP